MASYEESKDDLSAEIDDVLSSKVDENLKILAAENVKSVEENHKFDPENPDGNVEYKRHLCGKDLRRMERLSTQMQYRMKQGNGECLYKVGLDDDGLVYGITDKEFAETWDNLKKLSEDNDYSCQLLSKIDCTDVAPRRKTLNPKKVQNIPETAALNGDEKMFRGEFLVRENNVTDCLETRVGILGNVDHGKSSLMGRLVSGTNDDGRGSAREKIFNYEHEKQSGRTSSVSHQIVAYDTDGHQVLSRDNRKKNWPELTARSKKLVNLMDLCGQKKYFKTTVLGISMGKVDFGVIVVGANAGVQPITIEHIRLCGSYAVPVVFVVTKIDMVEKIHTEKTLKSIDQLLSKHDKIMYLADSVENTLRAKSYLYNRENIPVFQVSNVTGEGIDLLHLFLNTVRPRISFSKSENDPVLLHVETTFLAKVGLVISGFLSKGTIKKKHKYFLGPNAKGHFQQITVKGMHVKQRDKDQAECGRYVCVNIPHLSRNKVKRGMVITGNPQVKPIKYFTADIVIRENHPMTVRVGTELTMVVNAARITCKVSKILSRNKKNMRQSREAPFRPLRLGEKASILFYIKDKYSYFEVNDRAAFTEGDIKMTGLITDVDPKNDK